MLESDFFIDLLNQMIRKKKLRLKDKLIRFRSCKNVSSDISHLYQLKKGLNLFTMQLLISASRRQNNVSCCNSSFARSHLLNVMKNLNGWQSWSDIYKKCLQGNNKTSIFLSLLELLKQFRKNKHCKCCWYLERVQRSERQCIFNNKQIAPNCRKVLRCAILSWRFWVCKRFGIT